MATTTVKSKTLPSWVEALRSQDGDNTAIYGPSFGPVVSGVLEDYVVPAGIDPLEYLYGMMTQQSMLTLPNALGPAVSATVRVIPGHAGLCRHTRMGAVDPPSASFKYGPRPGISDIVVVGKHPADDEDRTGLLFAGASGRELREALAEGGVADFLDDAYFTNICWFNPPRGNFKKAFTKEFAWFIWAELVIIRPKLVILLGSDAIKHFYGNRLNVTNSRGQIMPLNLDPLGEEIISLQAFATIHPAAVARENTMRTGLASDLKRAQRWHTGKGDQDDRPRYADHWQDYVLDTVDKVRDYVEARLQEGCSLFSVDCEWEGRNVHSGGKLLTIQISHAEGESVLVPVHRHPRVLEQFVTYPDPMPVVDEVGARLIVLPSVTDAIVHSLEVAAGEDRSFEERSAWALRHDNGEYEITSQLVAHFSSDAWAVVLDLLKRLFLRPEARVGGHNFKSDLHWLKSVGLDLTEPFSRGFDTILQHHLIYESGQHGLEVCTLKYTTLGRYDFALGEFIRLSEGTGEGFGHVPEHILYPYALYDPDAALRIHKALDAELDAMPERDRDALRATLASDMAANIAIVEMEETGLLADRERILELADRYSKKYQDILNGLRETIAWPEFNPRSVIQCRELIFGEAYSGKVDNTGQPVRIRPPGATCCNLTPIKTTGRPAREWANVVAHGQEREYAPSTDKETLGILGVNNKIAATLRSLRFIDQVVKLYVSPPQVDSDTGEVTEGGLMRYIDADGRIRTTLLQLAETGRWMSRKPNLQNLPSRREKYLHGYFAGETPPHRIRSVLKAPPGYVLVESDYSSAELIVLGLASGDMGFYEAVTGKTKVPVVVDDDKKVLFWLHPDGFQSDKSIAVGDRIPAGASLGRFKDASGSWRDLIVHVDATISEATWKRDLHSERAIASFNLPYVFAVHGPPKKFVEDTADDKRIAAKTVNFGIPYGRGAPAVARELQQEGILITSEETQLVIDDVMQTYPLLALFLEKCRCAMREDGVIWTMHGRRRRFATNVEEHILVEQERESGNFPIQGEVACCLDRASANFMKAREALRASGKVLDYRLALAIHDAVMLMAHVSAVEALIVDGGVVDYCMRSEPSVRIPMPDRTICGGLYAHANPDLFPYALPIDKKVSLRWSEKPSVDELRDIGMSDRVIKMCVKS